MDRYQAQYCFSVRGRVPPAVSKLQAEGWLKGRFGQFRKNLAAVDNDEGVGVKVEEKDGKLSFFFEVHGIHIMQAQGGEEVASALRSWIERRHEELCKNLRVDTGFEDAVQIRFFLPPV